MDFAACRAWIALAFLVRLVIAAGIAGGGVREMRVFPRVSAPDVPALPMLLLHQKLRALQREQRREICA